MKKLLKATVFMCILIVSFVKLNDIVISKSENRYYMLKKELERKNEKYDVQIYGSCHAYTSFNSLAFQEEYGITSYNMSNPSEIIPVTYLKMIEQFEKYKPKVVLVETWGCNAYDTYIESESILNGYLNTNIAVCPLNKEKVEVINDFETLDVLSDSIPIGRYKKRILDTTLTKLDFDYSFEAVYENHKEKETFWLAEEMKNRFEHNGFKDTNPLAVPDYLEQQGDVAKDEKVAIEAVLMKYIDKIINLCQENDVALIFYRAPYVSKEVELQKANFLEEYLSEKNIVYIDIEKNIEFDYEQDFSDYQHLSTQGAEKATNYLAKEIMEYF